MKQAMKESRRIFEEGRQEHKKGASSSQPSNARIKRGLTRSFSVREGASIPSKGIDPNMFPSNQKSIKSLFSIEGMKKKQVQASRVLRDSKLEIHIWKRRCKNLRTRKAIINFMICCDRSMIYHSSVDTTNILKTTDYIFSLMDKVVEEVGEENVVQIVTDNEASFKAATMDRDILSIKASIKQWKNYWEVIDRRWEGQLHRHLYVVKLFVDGQGEFGSALTKKAINQSLPDEWWNNYGDEGPHLQNIVVKILSQTCSSSGCERNWSTWRLRVKNLMQEQNNEDLYNPIDLNHIFNHDDILDEWIREGEEPILSSDNLDWLDKGLPTNEEARDTIHEDDGATNRRASRRTSNATQEEILIHVIKGGGTSRGSRGVGGTGEGTGGDGNTGGGYVSQVDPNMSWAQRNENYYATQDTDHGYRPGIWEQQKHLERLTTFPNDDDYSSGDIQIMEHEIVIPMDIMNLLVVVTLLIEVLDTINMVLIPNSLRNHNFLIMGHQANHLNQHIRVMNNSFNHILTTRIVIPICILVIGL
ncbi:hypothetical protein CK203_062790 [Vitis vinifera]|uniref:DUF659 domain-containing protein n=1 Tax=Vitis vinifera TaxID=29760 RepID=A0A438GB48_VITVI|nr:hypothetical protein CK203_062790 [Vitis vinifera]